MSVAEVILKIKAQGYEKIDDVAAALEDVEEQAKRTERAQEDLGESAGKVGGGFAKLAGAADLLVPGLGEAARGLADVADVGEVAASVSKAVGISVGVMGVAFGAVLTVVGLVTHALVEQNKREDEAIQRNQRHAAALREVAEGLNAVRDAQADLEIREGLLTGELSQRDAAEIRAQNEAINQTEASRNKLLEERAILLGEINAIRGQAAGEGETVVGRLSDALFGASGGELSEQRQVAQEALDEVNRKLQELDATTKQYAGTLVTVTAGEEKATAKRDAAKKGLAAYNDEVKEAVGYLAKEDAAEREFWERHAKSLGDADKARAAANQKELDDFNALLKAEGQADAKRINEGEQAYEDYWEKRKEQAAAYQAYVNRYEADTASKIANATSALSSTGQALTSGSISGVIEAAAPAIGAAIAGPIGGAVGGAMGAWVGFLEGLGERGIEDIKASMQQSADNIVAGLKLLPELIAEVLPGVFMEVFPAYQQALVQSQFEMVGNFIQGIGKLLQYIIQSIGDFFRGEGPTREERRDRREARREAIGSAFKYLFTGEFATGTDFVPRTGLALVHQGERITPAHMREAGGGSGGEGGGVTINLNGFAIGTPDQLVRELNRALGDAGRRLAWRA